VDCLNNGDINLSKCAGGAVFDYIGGLIDKHTNESVKEIITYVMQTAVLYSIALLLLLAAYVHWAYGYAQLDLARQLKSQLRDLRREKLALQRKLVARRKKMKDLELVAGS